MKLTLDALITIETIVRTGSFSKAADELHRVRSALTYVVKKAEQDLNIQIFDRSSHRAKLTPIGKVLLDEGKHLLYEAQSLEDRLKALEHGWEEELSISYNELIPLTEFSDILQDFKQQCPYTQLKLTAERLNGTIESLTSSRTQLCIGLSGYVPEHTSLEHIAMPIMEFVFVVAPGHPLASFNEPLSPDLIAKYTSITATDSSTTLPKRSSGIETKQKTLSVSSLPAKVQAQVAGLGVGYLPKILIQNELNQRQLIIKEVSKSKPNLALHLVWHTKNMGKALKWLVNRLRNKEFKY